MVDLSGLPTSQLLSPACCLSSEPIVCSVKVLGASATQPTPKCDSIYPRPTPLKLEQESRTGMPAHPGSSAWGLWAWLPFQRQQGRTSSAAPWSREMVPVGLCQLRWIPALVHNPPCPGIPKQSRRPLCCPELVFPNRPAPPHKAQKPHATVH